MSDRRQALRTEFEVADIALLRAPLLQTCEFQRWRESALEAGSSRTSAWLLTACGNPIIREGIAVASRDLAAALETSHRSPDDRSEPPATDEGRKQRVQRSLARYATRAIGRPTPFGLFAGVAACRGGEVDDIRFGTRHRRFVQLDAWVEQCLVRALVKDPDVRGRIRFHPNPTLYHCGEDYRYTERREIDPARWQYELAGAERSHELECTLARAIGGATLGELAKSLTQAGLAVDDARGFVEELVDAQLLLPDTRGCRNDEPRPNGLRKELERVDVGGRWLDRVRRISEALDRLNEAAPGDAVDAYDVIWAAVDDVPGTQVLSTCVDVQLRYEMASAVIGKATRNRIAAAIGALAHLRHQEPSSPITRLQRELAAFRDAFYERYEGAALPLCKALDPENGIGFGGAWSPVSRSDDTYATWGPFEDFFFERIVQSMKNDWAPVEITEPDLQGLESPTRGELANAYGALVRIAPSRTPEALANIAMGGVAGPNPAMLFGRFCAGDPELMAATRELAGWTTPPHSGIVHAEISHEPLGRGANVVARPRLSQVEIGMLSGWHCDDSTRLSLSDLTVCVEDSRLVLYAARLGCEILPRLTSAHAAFQSTELPVYRFLFGIQMQGRDCYLTWSWRGLRHLPRLPRVTFKGVALVRARWEIPSSDVWQSLDSPLNRRLLQERYGLPSMVALAREDEELVVDFGNPEQLAAIRRAFAGARYIRFYELFPFGSDSEAPSERSGDRNSSNPPDKSDRAIELVIPVRQQQRASVAVKTHQPRSAPVVVVPGGECWFAKLYCGHATADRLLQFAARPLVARLSEMGLVERWFFVRYADPAHHLRLRVFASDKRLHAEATELMRGLIDADVADGSVSRVQIDTYRPEMDRYGGVDGISVAKRLFRADSEAVLDILGERWASVDSLRFSAAVAGTDALLTDFGLGLDNRVRMLRKMRDGLAARLFATESLLKAARLRQADRFRKERGHLHGLLLGDGEREALCGARAALATRSGKTRPLLKQLRHLQAQRKLMRPPEVLLESFVHMHLNRLFRNDHSTCEYELYDLLAQSYAALAARERASLTAGPGHE